MRTLPTFSTVRRRQHFGLGPAAIGLLSSPPRRPTSYVMHRTPLALNAASYSAVMPPLQIYSSHRRPWNSSLSFLFLLFHSSSPSSSSSGIFVPLRVPRSSRVGFDILVVRRTLRPFFNFFAVIGRPFGRGAMTTTTPIAMWLHPIKAAKFLARHPAFSDFPPSLPSSSSSCASLRH